jgi:hypothetical protein
MQKFGLNAGQNIYWSCRDEKNFGDWIGPLLFENMSGKEAIFCMPTQLRAGYTTFTVGSILHWIKVADKVDVWGSGIIRKDIAFKRPRKTFAVRGPRSRKRMIELGYNCPEIYGDPALTMPLLFPISKEPQYELGIVPHFVDAGLVKDAFAGRDDIRIIDVRSPPLVVAQEIASCHRIASSSLHGVIVAHAYGVPSMRLVLSDRLAGDGVKFADYAEAFGVRESLPTLNLKGKCPTKAEMQFIMDCVWLPEVKEIQRQLVESCPFVRDESRLKMLQRI